jgi:hypothetical protein
MYNQIRTWLFFLILAEIDDDPGYATLQKSLSSDSG